MSPVGQTSAAPPSSPGPAGEAREQDAPRRKAQRTQQVTKSQPQMAQQRAREEGSRGLLGEVKSGAG